MAALAATDWASRERQLCAAYVATATAHNDLELTPAQKVSTRRYYGRPYRVIGAERFAVALIDSIGDPALRQRARTGAVDQFIDSTDALGDLRLTRACVPEVTITP